MATRRNFTQEYKDQAVSLVLDSGRSIVDVAKSIGVHEMTLGKWGVPRTREVVLRLEAIERGAVQEMKD